VTLADLAFGILGVTSEDQRRAGREAALAFATIGQVRALPSLLQQRRHRLPLDMVNDHRIDMRALSEMVYHPSLGDLIEDLCDQAAEHILAARSVRPAAAYPVIAQARIAECYRKRLQRKDYNPFLPSIEKKPVLLPFLLMVDRIL